MTQIPLNEISEHLHRALESMSNEKQKDKGRSEAEGTVTA